MSDGNAKPFKIHNFNHLEPDSFERPPLYASTGGSLTAGTLAAKLGASYDCVPAGKRAAPYHFHYAQEEMFIITQGTGTLRLADEMIPIKQGDVLCIPPGPDCPHQIINTSDAPLYYVSISTMETPEICEYPDSNKYMAKATNTGGGPFHKSNFLSTGVDYWENEP